MNIEQIKNEFKDIDDTNSNDLYDLYQIAQGK